MYGVVLMLAMTGTGAGAGSHAVAGYAGGIPQAGGLAAAAPWPAYQWWGGPPGHGYGFLVTPVCTCCGVVMPPVPAEFTTSPPEDKAWELYVNELQGNEKKEMICLWLRADVHGRRELLKKLSLLRRQVEEERERDDPNRPLSNDELKRWEEYVGKLKGDRRKEAEEAWKKADNRGKRELLAEIDMEQTRVRPARPSVARQ